MKYERIEVRLDAEHLRKVAELKAVYGTTASEVIRRVIDEAWEQQAMERRLEIVRRMREMSFDVPDDPQELKKQLETMYDDHLP